ncbi:MAG: DUF4440 domain-containing protein [Myxococcales bacterium]|nr:DUF4440 domain-containing protein [Myxococcales bacterium]
MAADAIRSLEQHLLNPEVRANAQELARLIADDFVEIGMSGRSYTKDEVIAALVRSPSFPADTRIEDFHHRALASGIALVTYRAAGALRSSIWRRENDSWRIVFHQATAVSARK